MQEKLIKTEIPKLSKTFKKVEVEEKSKTNRVLTKPPLANIRSPKTFKIFKKIKKKEIKFTRS